jgi:hypothetical protein
MPLEMIPPRTAFIAKMILGFFATVLVIAAVYARDPTSTERSQIEAAMRSFNAAFIDQDAEATAAQTHPKFLETFGGRESYVKLLKEIYLSRGSFRASIISQSVSAGRIIVAGQYELCVVDELTVHMSGGRRFHTKGYALAVRTSPSGQWRFIGGNAFREDPSLLRDLFPEIPPSFSLPEYVTRPV